ncbi:carbohydrate ABC transporter permease [Jiangella rhizosphaerae]|uniref:Carbohydrate ABC transporter permease n=1 Tax=Jiangella rhizosphaerae TaxID=2293569 RepID=A0A418KM07_9ACTN|nr:carbohydrate ABC transporter permease [Jiangella rhizosphaerae]RIQ18990.1 carbohydrate ABC transporter permease [Jiangella rhizosphaerae]
MRPRSWAIPVRYVAMAAVALLFVGPFLILFTTALKPSDQQVFSFPPSLLPWPPAVDHLVEAWHAIPFGRYLLNSLIYVVATVPLYMTVSALTAYPLARYAFRGRQLCFYLILSILFLSPEVMLIPRFLVVSELGLTDTFLGVILPSGLSASGVFLLRQAFAAIPAELPDSARVDGANEFRIFWSVMLPQVRPTLAVLGIFGFVSVWNNFVWPLVVLKDSDKYPIALGLAYLDSTLGADARTVAAGALIALAPVVIVFLAMQRQFIEGMQGSMKG